MVQCFVLQTHAIPNSLNQQASHLSTQIKRCHRIEMKDSRQITDPTPSFPERDFKTEIQQALRVSYGKSHKCTLNMLKHRWENHFHLNKSWNTSLGNKLWLGKTLSWASYQEYSRCLGLGKSGMLLNRSQWRQGYPSNDHFDKIQRGEWSCFWQSGMTQRGIANIDWGGALGHYRQLMELVCRLNPLEADCPLSARMLCMRDLLPNHALRTLSQRAICLLSLKCARIWKLCNWSSVQPGVSELVWRPSSISFL